VTEAERGYLDDYLRNHGFIFNYSKLTTAIRAALARIAELEARPDPPAPAAIVQTTARTWLGYESREQADDEWRRTLNTVYHVDNWLWHPSGKGAADVNP
jgi:hypothetical protein